MATVKSLRERARERAMSHKGGNSSTVRLPDGVDWFSPRKGTVTLDIIPYKVSVDNHPQAKKGELWYERTFFAHRDIGPEQAQVVCPSTFGQPCPICEAWRKMRKEEGADQDSVDALRPRERQLFNVIDVDKDPDKVLVWDVSFHLFGKLLEQEVREGDEDNAAFCELKKGKSLKIRFEEVKNGKFTFMEAKRIDFVDREDLDDSFLNDAVDLDETLVILSYEELNQKFNGGEPAEKEDEPEETRDEPPAPSRRRGAREEAPPPPPARRRGAAPAHVPEPEPEEPEGKEDGERTVTWEYKDVVHTGVVVEELDDEAIRVRDDADGKVKFLNAGEYEDVQAPEPPPTRTSRTAAPPARRAPAPEPEATPPTRRRRVAN